VDTLRQDLRFAPRLFWKDRAFAITTILTLASCIGANTGIFTVVRSVILRHLPYPDAGRLVFMYDAYPGAGVERAGASVPTYFDQLALTDVLESEALYRWNGFRVGQGASAEGVSAIEVTPSFFRVLRAHALRGRLFTEDEGKVGHNHVALRYDPAGQKLGAQTFVFGTEVGDRIGSVKTAWRSACERAAIVGLHFHDLRREFACRLLESRAELHDVRDFLGHANITTTSRYLRSTSLRLERALRLLEEAEFRTGATPVPHGVRDGGTPNARETSQLADLLEDGVVSPEGIEPSTYRLRVCCSAN
jgi:Phage integrase family/MacB-like periplasmic core domain